jgi:hypothetical protein
MKLRGEGDSLRGTPLRFDHQVPLSLCGRIRGVRHR